jgi:hypothetical protein
MAAASGVKLIVVFKPLLEDELPFSFCVGTQSSTLHTLVCNVVFSSQVAYTIPPPFASHLPTTRKVGCWYVTFAVTPVMPQVFLIAEDDNFEEQLLVQRLDERAFDAVLQMVAVSRYAPFSAHAYAIGEQTVYVVRRPQIQPTPELYVCYIVSPPRPGENADGIIVPVAGGYGTFFETRRDAVFVEKTTGRPVAPEDADQDPPEDLLRIVTRALQKRSRHH